MLTVAMSGEFTLPPDCDLKVIQRLTIRRAIQALSPRHPRILEIGPGPSRDILDHVASGEYWILDPEPQWSDPRVRVLSGTLGQDMTLPEGYFDVICSVSVLEHLPHASWMRASEQLYRALRVGGLSLHCIDGKATGVAGDHFEQMLLWKEMFLNTGMAWLRPPWPLSSARVHADSAVWSMSEAAWQRWWAQPGERWADMGRPVSINIGMVRPRFRLRRHLYRVNRALSRRGLPVIAPPARSDR